MRVFVARKPCGHIVAAFPVSMEKNAKAEILKQLTKAGYDIEQALEAEVREKYDLSCDCGKPPLLELIDQQEEGVQDEGVDYHPGTGQADVDALGNEDETREEEEDEAEPAW